MSDVVITPGLTSEQISATTRQTNYGTWRFQKTWKPLHIVDAEGCWFTDGAGKRYLDFSVAADVRQPGPQESARGRSHRRAGAGTGVCRARSTPPRRAPGSAPSCSKCCPRASTNSSSPPAAPRPTKRPSRSPAWSRARTRSSPATAPITAPRQDPSPPPATRAAGPWSRRARAWASSSRRRPTATTAPSSTPIPAATSPAPTTSST